MRYLTFSNQEQGSYEICFLVPQLNRAEMVRHYIEPHLKGLEDRLLAYDLHKEGKKTSVKVMREYLEDLLPILEDLSSRYLVVTDGEYFKTLTKAPKVENTLGYVLDCAHPGFEHMKVLYCPNFTRVFHNPEKVSAEIGTALGALEAHRRGTYADPGIDIIKFADYPDTVDAIELWLHRLLEMDCDLTGDIETFSLKFIEAGIGTISFSWTKHEGIAFPVDLLDRVEDRIRVRALLVRFFEAFARTGRTMIWHNAGFDVTVLIYQLFMKDILDTRGLLYGMEVMLSNWEDTQLIAYLATNTCAGNVLGLKANAQEFAGNYAVDEIEDITKIPLPQLLQYNLVDTLATWFVHEKHWVTMVADDQLPIYQEIFKPALLDIVQMQLTGLPMDMDRVIVVRDVLQAISDDAIERMQAFKLVQEFVYEQTLAAWEKDYEDRRAKAKKPEKIKRKDFATFPEKPLNPNSPQQLQSLLYDERWLGLPVLDLTDTKQPATGGDTLEKLVNHTDDPQVKAFIEALIEYKAIDKVLTAFLPSFLEAPQAPDGWHYLCGSFKLGGTVSGRLSSANPNLQNLPAKVFVAIREELLDRHRDVIEPYMKKGKLALGKLVKSCFKAPPGYLFIGLDFNSLEDRISALTTRDPNKIKVYTDGFDGHCLRAYTYFEEQMPDIDPNSVESVNSIEKVYPDLRQESKTPTFLMTYQGTFRGMMEQLGWSMEKALEIERRYHELYKVSDEWVAARIAEAGQQGYVTGAFGLRLRTPLLRQVILGTSRTPFEAEAEGRTAGNMLGQSWCLLNSRAGSEFMGKVRSSEYRLDIRPCAQIHDAQYFLIPDDIRVLRYVNEHLVRAVQWQDDPLIWHDEVKLGGELSVFFPDWSAELVIPNGASVDTILELAAKHHADYSE